ncbi:23134_t:CDS:2, partial [Gigaspora margarita]
VQYSFYNQNATSLANDTPINGFIEPLYDYHVIQNQLCPQPMLGLDKEKLLLINESYSKINNYDEVTNYDAINAYVEINDYDEINDYNEIFDTDSSDEENNIVPSGLYVGQSFQTWDEAEEYLNNYGKEKGFSIRRKRSEGFLENENKVVTRINWECSCAGKYQPKKVLNPANHRNRQSKVTDCKWKVNGNMSKKLSSSIIFTTVVDEHNHPMTPSPNTTIAKYRKFNSKMIQFIEFCVKSGISGAQPIGRLLKSKFPEIKIHQKNLYNAIQAAKKHLAKRVKFDASDLMCYLYSNCTEDSRWFVESRFDGPERRLNPSKTKWAVCYINNQFTAGANSTQRVESLNRKIHTCVGSNSSLLELVKEIQDVLDKESNYMRMKEYENEIPKVGLATVPKTFFNSIETIISQYLMPTMVFKEQVNMDYDEGMREDNYELMKVHLVNMVEKVGHEQIIEIWKLTLSCGTKTQYIILTVDENPNEVWEQSPISLCINNIPNQDIISDFGYLKEIRNPDVYTLVLQKINSTRQKYGRAQGIMWKQNDEFNIGNLIITARRGRPPGRAKSAVEIQENPTKKRRHLQPINVNQVVNKSETGHDRLKEKDTRKTCQNCKQKGHNRAT